MRKRGFTLIELMIVVAIIAIIAAVAIPGLLRSRIGSNEASAQGSLKAINTGQEQFKSAVCVDQNLNGTGEYGYLCELGGLVACRNNTGTIAAPAFAKTGNTFTANPYIPRILGNVPAAAPFVSSKSGYHFDLWLPLTANTAGDDYTGDAQALIAAGMQETGYIAYGWPQNAGRTGVRVFTIDPSGQPYSWANTASTFSGTTAPPAWDDAFAVATSWASYIHDGGAGNTGVAGQNWTPTG